jgi:hypothetical protein
MKKKVKFKSMNLKKNPKLYRLYRIFASLLNTPSIEAIKIRTILRTITGKGHSEIKERPKTTRYCSRGIIGILPSTLA